MGQLSPDQKQVIIGTLLGNSWIKIDRRGPRLMMRNTSYRWLQSKSDALKEMKEYEFTRGMFSYWVGKPCEEIIPFYDLLYRANKKYVPMSVLDQLNGIGLTAWYGDIGCLVGRNNQYACLRTQHLHDYADTIHKFFNDVGIEANLNLIREKKVVVFSKSGTHQLLKIVCPHLPQNRYHLVPKFLPQ